MPQRTPRRRPEGPAVRPGPLDRSVGADAGHPAALRVQLYSSDLLASVAAMSPDGDKLAVGVVDGDILLWDLRDDAGAVARRGHRRLHVGASVGSIRFEPDGALLVVTAESISRWRDDLPDDPEGLRRWLAERADLAEPPKPQLGCAAPA